jgi:hypothetical protein
VVAGHSGVPAVRKVGRQLLRGAFVLAADRHKRRQPDPCERLARRID